MISQSILHGKTSLESYSSDLSQGPHPRSQGQDPLSRCVLLSFLIPLKSNDLPLNPGVFHS